MSALRTASGFVDPYTRRPYVPPEPHPYPVFGVTVRKATPDELARLDGPVPVTDGLGMVPRPIRGVLKDREIAEMASRRRGAAATRALTLSDLTVTVALRDAGGNVSACADRLGVPVSSMHRRVAAMRSAGIVPDDIPSPADAKYGARRQRGTCL